MDYRQEISNLKKGHQIEIKVHRNNVQKFEDYCRKFDVLFTLLCTVGEGIDKSFVYLITKN